jgi:hypothetical protein
MVGRGYKKSGIIVALRISGSIGYPKLPQMGYV